MQNQYSLIYREEEREMFPTLKVSAQMLMSLLSSNLLKDVWRRSYPLVPSRSRFIDPPDQCPDETRWNWVVLSSPIRFLSTFSFLTRFISTLKKSPGFNGIVSRCVGYLLQWRELNDKLHPEWRKFRRREKLAWRKWLLHGVFQKKVRKSDPTVCAIGKRWLSTVQASLHLLLERPVWITWRTFLVHFDLHFTRNC